MSEGCACYFDEELGGGGHRERDDVDGDGVGGGVLLSGFLVFGVGVSHFGGLGD